MKDDEKTIVQLWKDVLKQYLDPLEMIDGLSEVFPVHSPEYRRIWDKRKEPHEAVGIVIEEVMNSNILFEQFAGAIRKSGHGWLAALVSGQIADGEVEEAILEKENAEYIREFLTIISPHLKATIRATEVAERLVLVEVIIKDEFERIECRAREDGNRDAVRLLLSILVRKQLGWWKRFTAILKDLNYDLDLLDSLDSLSINEPTQYATSDTKGESASLYEPGFKEDAANPEYDKSQQGNSRMAAKFYQDKAIKEAGRMLREYQEDLAYDAINRKNVIICAPTGCGKTRVASHIIYTRFNAVLESHEPKVAFMVPRVSLAKQQHDNIKSYFSSMKWSIDYLIGDSKSTLKDSLRNANVIVMTAQILLNALKDGSVHSLKKFDMIIFDECHHTMKDTPYNIIMSQYLEMKQRGNGDLPQIIGLTATLGVGKGKRDSDAIDHMLTLCANLDATGGIVTVPLKHRDELNRFTPQAEEDNVALDGDDTIKDPFTFCICEAIDEMVKILYGMNLQKIKGVTRPHPIPKGSQQYVQWCQDFAAKANRYLTDESDIRVCRDVQACIGHLRVFNESLDLHFKCRAIDALKYLERNMNRPYDTNMTVIEDRLYNLSKECIRKLNAYYNDPRSANQNLRKMEQEILDTFRKDANSRAMLNVLKRQYAEPIRDWLNESEAMKHLHLRAEYFTGVGKSRDGATSGLTHNKQEHILDMFRNGDIKVLVCTPEVASEGMDIVDCNLVICYDYVKNEISKTQVKGRARKEGGRMVQFSSRAVMARDKVNISKFLLMEKTTEIIQNMFRIDQKKYMDELHKLQKLAIVNYRLKHKLTAAKCDEPMESDRFRVLCKKCSEFACKSEDIEVVNGTNHTCNTEEFKQKYILRPVEDGGTEKKNSLHCKNCDSTWGILAKVRRIVIPQLKPEAFKFIDERDLSSEPLMGSKWRSIKIQFKEAKYEDLAARLTSL